MGLAHRPILASVLVGTTAAIGVGATWVGRRSFCICGRLKRWQMPFCGHCPTAKAEPVEMEIARGRIEHSAYHDWRRLGFRQRVHTKPTGEPIVSYQGVECAQCGWRVRRHEGGGELKYQLKGMPHHLWYQKSDLPSYHQDMLTTCPMKRSK